MRITLPSGTAAEVVRPEGSPRIGLVVTPDIFGIIRNTPPGRNNEVQITDALLTKAKQGRVLGYRFKGRRFDCGSVPGFMEATRFFFDNVYKD